MRHTVLVLIREPILQDKSEMEGMFGGERDEGGGNGKDGKKSEGETESEGWQGVDLSRAWGQPTRQKGE